jgi:hypothetical protein
MGPLLLRDLLLLQLSSSLSDVQDKHPSGWGGGHGCCVAESTFTIGIGRLFMAACLVQMLLQCLVVTAVGVLYSCGTDKGHGMHASVSHHHLISTGRHPIMPVV